METFTVVPSLSDNPEDVKMKWKDPRKMAGMTHFSKGKDTRRLLKKRKVEEWPHYAAVVMDNDGEMLLMTSPTAKQAKAYILSQAATRLREHISESAETREVEKVTFPKPPPNKVPRVLELPQKASITYPFHHKRHRKHTETTESQEFSDSEPDSNSEKADEYKFSRNPTSRREFTLPSSLLAIRADQVDKWEQWFLDGFKTIQQTACRTIAKEWIKTIHPKKQSTHPYNGNMPRSEHRSPERTRPPYWPQHVRHKEPDHIDKADRTALLVHLIMHTPQEEIVPDKAKSENRYTARDLLVALQKKQDSALASKWPILKELVNVREQLENYDDGGMDDDTVLHVLDWSEVLRAVPKKKTGASKAASNEEDDGELPSKSERGSQQPEATDRAEASMQQHPVSRRVMTERGQDEENSAKRRATVASLDEAETVSNIKFIQEHDIAPDAGAEFHFEEEPYNMGVHNTVDYRTQMPGSEFHPHQLQPNVQAYTGEPWHSSTTSGHHMTNPYLQTMVGHGVVDLVTDPRYSSVAQTARAADMEGVLQSPQYTSVPSFSYTMTNGRYHADHLNTTQQMQQARPLQHQQQHPSYDMDGSFYLN